MRTGTGVPPHCFPLSQWPADGGRQISLGDQRHGLVVVLVHACGTPRNGAADATAESSAGANRLIAQRDAPQSRDLSPLFALHLFVLRVRHAPSPPHASLFIRQSIACPCPRSVYCETTARSTFSFGGMVLGSSRKFKTFEEEGAGLLLGSALLSAAPSGGPSWARLSRRTERAVPHSAPNRPGKAEEQQRHSDAASRCHRARRPATRRPHHPATARWVLELARIEWPFSQRLARRQLAASPRGQPHPPATVPPLVRARRPVFGSLRRPARPRPASRSLSHPLLRAVLLLILPPRRETSICSLRRGGRARTAWPGAP